MVLVFIQRSVLLCAAASLVWAGCTANAENGVAAAPNVPPQGAAAAPANSSGAAPGANSTAAGSPAASAPGGAAANNGMPAGPAAPAAPGGSMPVSESDGNPPPAEVPGPVEWTMFNYDLNNSRNNTSETKITVANVATLIQKWSATLQSGVTSTPIVAGGQVYVTDHGGSLYALNAETGQQTWIARGIFQLGSGTPLVVGDIVYSAGGRTLYAHDKDSGMMLWQVPLHDHPNTMINSSPLLVKDRVIVGIANYEVISSLGNYTGRGAVFAATLGGMQAWKFFPSADNADQGAGVSVWSSAAADLERNLIFIGTGQAYELPAGPHSDALIAINPSDGMLIWANQFHEGDVYTDPGGCAAPRQRPNCDWDIGASPNLFRAQGMDVVGVGSKGGLYRVVDRDTGSTVVWERQLGPGSALGGMMSVAAVSDRAVLVVSNNFRTDSVAYALDKQTGEDIWQLPLPAPVWGAVSYANGVFYVSSRDGILRAIDAGKGMELKNWDIYADAAGGVSISDGVVYVSSGFTGLGTLARTGARVTAFSLP